MSATAAFPPGGYRYIPAVFQYSSGIAAEPGFAIERARFARPLPLAAGFANVEAYLQSIGRPVTAFAACELRSPTPFTEQGFFDFNKGYVATLERWGIYTGGDKFVNPVARTNVCPMYDPPREPVMFAFSYTVAARAGVSPRGTFVLAVNHLSLMDLPLVLTVLPRPATLLASGHLRRSALMDWFVSDLGRAIYIARGEGDRGALDRALEVLRAGGVLALGPEGTRSTTGGLGRGHSGVAYLATASGAPVLPLVAWGQEGLTRAWTRLRRAPIEVRIGPPLQFPRGHASAAQLREYTDQVMHALAAQLPTAYRGVYGSAAAPSPGRAGGE